MATIQEILDGIKSNLGDSGDFYTQNEILDSLQDGYSEIAAVTGCIEKGVTVPISLSTVYYDLAALIPDFLSLVALYNRRVKRWMIPVSLRELDLLRENWETANGEPYLFVPINYRYIAIFPSPLTATALDLFYVFYKAKAGTITVSTTPEIPDAICADILDSYSTQDMYEQAEEWMKAGEIRKAYLEKIDEITKWVNKRDKERLMRLGGSL